AKLEDVEVISPWITEGAGDLEGALWARGFLHCVGNHQQEWQKLLGRKRNAEHLMMPLLALLPADPADPAASATSRELRHRIIDALPAIALAAREFWDSGESAVFDA